MKTRLMGILNVTPDSFYDGGKYADTATAIDQALKLVEDGADIIDVGGESTRPGSGGVETDEEISRVAPVIEGICKRTGTAVSIDTRKSIVALEAVNAGATIVNDVSGLRHDPAMVDTVAKLGLELILMHSIGDPVNMQDNPRYDDVIGEINLFFRDRIEFSTSKGIDASKITIDPGIGFGKSLEHNLEIIGRLDSFQQHNLPVLVGPSNKSFIGLVLDEPSGNRMEGTIAACVMAVCKGASILRVHDVGSIRRAVKIAEAIIERKQTVSQRNE